MKTRRWNSGLACGLLAACSLHLPGAAAHPASGIVVDSQGQVIFIDTGHGLWQVEAGGRLRSLGGPAWHFLTFDPRNKFQPQDFSGAAASDVRVIGNNPRLIAGAEYPLAIGADGACYFPQVKAPGRVQLMRQAPSGQVQPFAELPAVMELGFDGKPVAAEWIWALAAGSDGSLYYTQQRAVYRVSSKGQVELLADNVHVEDCQHPPLIQDDHADPGLYGLAAAADGTVFVAASTCSAVLRIAPGQSPEVVLRAGDGWSPQGLALHGQALYVLEYHAGLGQGREDWLPRVRKRSADGTVSLVAEVKARPETAHTHGYSYHGPLEHLDGYLTPAMAHAAVIHFPVVLSLLCAAAAVPALFVGARPAWRWQMAVLFWGVLVSCRMAEATGNRAELDIPYGEQGAPPVVWEHLRVHTTHAGRLKTWAQLGSLSAIVALLPLWRPWFVWPRRIACLGCLVLALGGVVEAGRAAHQGGELVYRQGLGTATFHDRLAEQSAQHGRPPAEPAEKSP